MAIAAVIFDLDGTVLLNEQVWETAFRAVMDKYQISNVKLQMPNGWIHEPGIGVESNWKRMVPADRVQELSQETREEFRNLGRGVDLRPGVIELIQRIKERKWLTGLATSTYWYVVEDELEQLSLELAFDVMTTGEEVMAPKPDPEIYLLTAQKLNVEPKECLVIEDSVGGVRAGVEAGMQVLALESDYAPEKLLLAAGAKWAVTDLEALASLLPDMI